MIFFMVRLIALYCWGKREGQRSRPCNTGKLTNASFICTRRRRISSISVFFQIKFSVSMLHDGNCPYTVFALGEPGKIISEEKNLSPAAAGDSALAGLFARKGIEGALALSSLKNGRTCGLLRHRHSGFSTPKSTHLRFKRQGALIPYTCVK